MKHNIIGAGRLGKNIALALAHTEHSLLNGICNRSLESAQHACNELGAGKAMASLKELPRADVTWITAKDDAIPSIVNTLAQNSLVQANSIVVHCSGVLNSTVLAPLKELGCFVASLHPLKAFKAGPPQNKAFTRVHCVVEGDEEACTLLKTYLMDWGAKLSNITPENKASYHAAATIASNYLITLASYSEQLLLQAGIKKEQAREMICHLMEGNISNLKQTPNLPDTLTGPLMRGDVDTLALHLNAINNPLCSKLYKAAGLATLPITSLNEEKKNDIVELLT